MRAGFSVRPPAWNWLSDHSAAHGYAGSLSPPAPWTGHPLPPAPPAGRVRRTAAAEAAGQAAPQVPPYHLRPLRYAASSAAPCPLSADRRRRRREQGPSTWRRRQAAAGAAPARAVRSTRRGSAAGRRAPAAGSAPSRPCRGLPPQSPDKYVPCEPSAATEDRCPGIRSRTTPASCPQETEATAAAHRRAAATARISSHTAAEALHTAAASTVPAATTAQ